MKLKNSVGIPREGQRFLNFIEAILERFIYLKHDQVFIRYKVLFVSNTNYIVQIKCSIVSICQNSLFKVQEV